MMNAEVVWVEGGKVIVGMLIEIIEFPAKTPVNMLLTMISFEFIDGVQVGVA